METGSNVARPTAGPLLVLRPEDDRWVEFVQHHPEALPFHHPSWSQVLSDSYGHRPFVLSVAGPGGVIEAGMPVVEVRRRLKPPKWVSLPFSDRCPLLAVDHVAAERLVELADQARKEATVDRLEVHADLPGTAVHRRPRGVVHLLSLSPDPELTFQRFSRSHIQRNVRKAERSGLALRLAEDPKDLTEAFYHLHARTRRRLGVPVQPRRFFDFLWRRVIGPGRGFVLLADRVGSPVAGAVFLVAGRTVVYKFGASEPSSWPLRPNNLIFWHAIRWSCENGFLTFDFGRSDFEAQGLRRFKNGWGAVEEPLRYAALGEKPPPVRQLRGASVAAPLIRRAPLWLCRGIGEVAYRYGV